MAQPFSIPLHQIHSSNECSHLASGDYRARIASLCVKYPNLRYPDLESPLQDFSGRVVSLDLSSESKATRRDFQDPAALESYIEARNDVASAAGNSRRLFLVEGLEPRLTGVLGQCFDIDPMLIVRQQRTASWEPYHRSGNTPTLPSLLEPSRTFHIPYYELRYYPQGLPDQLDWRCADSGRQISSSRMPGTFDRVGIVDRKVSYWSQKYEDHGWDGGSPNLVLPYKDAQ